MELNKESRLHFKQRIDQGKERLALYNCVLHSDIAQNYVDTHY